MDGTKESGIEVGWRVNKMGRLEGPCGSEKVNGGLAWEEGRQPPEGS